MSSPSRLPNTRPPLVHRIYQRVRPHLFDIGFHSLARRLLSTDTRQNLARRIGLAGFNPGTAPGTHMPGWARKKRVKKKNAGLQGVNYIGDLKADLGLSEAGRLTVSALQNAGLEVAYTEVPYAFKSRTQRLPLPLLSGSPFDITVVDINFSQFYDAVTTTSATIFRHKYIVAVWAWELPIFPVAWHKNFALVDEVWVGSRFTADAIAISSPVPVIRMPFPIELNKQAGRLRGDYGLPENDFLFFFTFSASSTAARKNPLALIDAFELAFGSNPLHVRLVLKAQHLDLPESRQLAQILRQAIQRVHGILIEDTLSRAEMNDLLMLTDCYVSLHRSEGFGLSIAEAMAAGKPVIATGYSGNMDYMNPTNSYLVGYQLKEITQGMHQLQPSLSGLYPIGYSWAEPDVIHAAELMRYVVENPTEAQQTGEKAHQDMLTHYSKSAVGRRLYERLGRIQQFSSV